MTNSTLEKGDDFENRSRGILERLIDESQIPLLKEYIKIYSRREKGYYSKDREGEIFFDLTIEVWPPNAEIYSLVYFIECKNYGTKSVPVDDVEEFYSKVRQVSGLNVKAIIIANTSLQKGGYTFAKNKGIMFVQGESADNYQIILHRSSLNNAFKIPLLEETIDLKVFNKDIKPLVELIDSVILNSFKKIENPNHVSYNIDKLSKNQIIQIAEKELAEIDPKIIIKDLQLSVKKLSNYITDNLNIELDTIESNSEILGNYNSETQTISINKKIIGTERELFVLAHELGHYVLHTNLLIGQVTYESFEDSKINFQTGRHDLTNPKNWIEWQANQFASALILPQKSVQKWLFHTQNSKGLTQGIIYLDDQLSNQKTFNEIVKHLAYIFNVSKTSVIYKLKEINLLKETSRLKSIRDIINEYQSELYL